jgi:Reverse transcriptase (RNA-dependent DNA polymerase)
MAGLFGYRIWSDDVSQAFLQSTEKMGRGVFIRPPAELGFSSDIVLELVKPLYGLPDAGDLWHATFSNCIKRKIGMEVLASDSSLFYKKDVDDRLQGAMGTYVDDSVSTGTDDFEEATRKPLSTFDSRQREYDDVTFADVAIKRNEDAVTLSQGH